MAYDLSWGSKHPGLLIYLVDLSGSMAWDDKIKRVSNTIWNVVDCLTAPCQDNGVYKNRYYLKVIGYNQYTYDLFSGDINDINSWLDAHDNEQFIDIEKEGKPRGLTHMSIAFDKAAEVVRKWIGSQNVKGQPIPAPIVINITDGDRTRNTIPFQSTRRNAQSIPLRCFFGNEQHICGTSSTHQSFCGSR